MSTQVICQCEVSFTGGCDRRGTHISNSVCRKSTAAAAIIVLDVVRVRCHHVRVHIILTSCLFRSSPCKYQTQLVEEVNPLLLRPRSAQPFPCLAGERARPIHKHVDEHPNGLWFCGQEVEECSKVDCEPLIIASDDLTDDVDANICTFVVSSVHRDLVDLADVDDSPSRILALLVEWLSIQPGAPPVHCGVTQAYCDSHIVVASFFCVVDEDTELFGASVKEVFVYMYWRCTVISANGDDVRRQAVMFVRTCNLMFGMWRSTYLRSTLRAMMAEWLLDMVAGV